MRSAHAQTWVMTKLRGSTIQGQIWRIGSLTICLPAIRMIMSFVATLKFRKRLYHPFILFWRSDAHPDKSISCIAE